MGQEKGLLTPTEISSSEYESEAKSNIGLVLSTQEQSLPTPLPLTLLSLSPSPPLPYEISQPDYSAIIRQLQEQITVLSEQVVGGGRGRAVNLDVVATTRHSRTNDLTTSKALQWAIK